MGYRNDEEHLAAIDYEARFLELATRPGMEGLRRACQCKNGRALKHILVIDAEYQLQDTDYEECYRCQGRGWLPKPVPERMGPLVQVTRDRGHTITLYPDDSVLLSGFKRFSGSTHWIALTEALLAATQEVVDP